MDFDVFIACRDGWRVRFAPGDVVELWTAGSVLLGTIRAEILMRLLAHHLEAGQLQAAFDADLKAPPRRPLGRTFLPMIESKQWKEEQKAVRKSRKRAG